MAQGKNGEGHARLGPVVLGADIDMHRGIYHSLTSSPPPDVTLETRGANHWFLFPGPATSPFADYHWGEFLDFGPGTVPVHSAHWPVINRPGWIMETGDFGYPVLVGRHALSPAFRAMFPQDWSSEFHANLLKRTQTMLSAFCHESCKAVVFRTQHAVRMARQWLVNLQCGPVGDAFLSKTRVICPAQAPAPPEVVEAKWRGEDKLRVIFCGRDYDAKNGGLALRLFERLLAQGKRLRPVYIGEIPDAARQQHAAVLRKIELHPNLSRDEVLRQFSQAHVLFHPSQAENVGMVFIEAASFGTGVVTATGRGMEHTPDFFDNGGAIIVDRTGLAAEEVESRFYELLSRLCDDLGAARELGWKNYELTVSGRFSPRVRNAALRALYEEAAESRSSALALDDLGIARDSVRLLMDSRGVLAANTKYAEEIGLRNSIVLV